jgi:DNA-binding FadR family transcriptional regulator
MRFDLSHRMRKRSDLIVDQVKSWIVAGRLSPGSRLPNERELIESFGMSKGTVREALKALEVQGLVTTKTGPGGGGRLTRVSYDAASESLRNFFYFSHLSYDDIYRIRIELEPLLARDVTGRLSAADLDRLRELIEVCEQATEDDEQKREQRLAEFEFHNVLAGATGNHLLGFLCRFMNELLGDLLVYKGEDRSFEQSFADRNICFHKDLLAAFEAEDADRAESEMREHMVDAFRRLSKMPLTMRNEKLLVRT